MLYLSGSNSINVVEGILQTVIEGLDKAAVEQQAEAVKHLKEDMVRKRGVKPGTKKPPKTPAEKKAKVVKLTKKLKEKAKAIPKEKADKKDGPRLCITCKKAKPRTQRSKRCHPCQKEIRKAQLARNNIAWNKRKEQGKAKHHATYRGKPTVWAATHKEQALAYAKKHGVLPVEKVKAALDKYGKKIAEQASA